MAAISDNEQTGIFVLLGLRILESVQSHFLLYCAAFFLLFAPKCIRYYRVQKGLNSLPLVGTVGSSIGDCIREGTKKYPKTPFRIPTIPKPTVIYPLEVLDEYKDLPENQISIRKVLYDSFGGKYTSLGQYSHAMLSAVQIDLTKNISKTLNTLNDEVKYAFEQNIGKMDDWQAVVMEPKLLRIVALLNGRVLVGLPLSRDENWIEATTQYTSRAYKFADKLKGYPWGTRWAVGPSLYRSDVKPHQDAVARMLEPLINQRLARQTKSVDDDDLSMEAGEMIGWTMAYYKQGETTYHRVALDQLMISFSSIHTSTVTLLQAIFDLAARPEYAEPLRQEIVDHSVDGKLDKYGVANLKKLDSFIKESQRLNPQTPMALIRKTTSHVKLSVGPELPPDTMIAVSAWESNNGPDIVDPDNFDGFRFEKLRRLPGNELKYQLAGTGRYATGFGFGGHACPGRFFAINEMKIIFAYLLLNYDIKTRDGRPKNLQKPTGTIYPDPKAEILFKSRTPDVAF
ncbi:cytochrome P450 monooxygenase [Macrophomina phaseolina]|uniref:Cytochrome P450 monooxygenase n=1 Tax=Macrophomina phaseolina TaxID=35725 RepID=A0ABQ8G892_9PEZI|nr:cytochrome P450 monooxygenase [Macrophomina phaseolina]